MDRCDGVLRVWLFVERNMSAIWVSVYRRTMMKVNWNEIIYPSAADQSWLWLTIYIQKELIMHHIILTEPVGYILSAVCGYCLLRVSRLNKWSNHRSAAELSSVCLWGLSVAAYLRKWHSGDILSDELMCKHTHKIQTQWLIGRSVEEAVWMWNHNTLAPVSQPCYHDDTTANFTIAVQNNALRLASLFAI